MSEVPLLQRTISTRERSEVRKINTGWIFMHFFWTLEGREKLSSLSPCVCLWPQTPPSGWKVVGWNFAYRFFSLWFKNYKPDFWNFVWELRYESFSNRLSQKSNQAYAGKKFITLALRNYEFGAKSQPACFKPEVGDRGATGVPAIEGCAFLTYNKMYVYLFIINMLCSL